MSVVVGWNVAALLLCAGTGEKSADKVRETVLIRENDLTVRLNVWARATLADTAWMALEFQNRGDKPLTVSNLHYWIRAEYFRLGTDQGLASGSLASGNTYDVFPHAWATTPISPIVLQPGETYRAVQQPSDYSAALLGLPTAPGWTIRGRIYMAVDVAGRQQFATNQQAGEPFSFDWVPPGEAGFEALRARLERLLRKPENRATHAYVLALYLRTPQIARGASAAELVAGLDLRSQPFEGRSDIADHLAKHFAGEPAVTAYYRRRLDDGDTAILEDLRRPPLWDREYAERLVRLFESDPRKYHEALDTLHLHRRDWAGDAPTTRRLSAALERVTPALAWNVSKLDADKLESWSYAVDRLAKTGEVAVVPRLRPALEDRRAFRSTKLLSMPMGMRVPPLRVCDVALDAILTLLDGGVDTAYRRAGPAPHERATLDASYASLRDGMIADLKRRLPAEK